MSKQIVKYSNFDTSKLTFSEPKRNKYGGKSVYMLYDGAPLTIQTPKMYLPYGLTEYPVKDSSGNDTTKFDFSLKLSFKDHDKKKDVALFLEKMKDMSEVLLTEAENNSVKWFKKKHNRDVLKALFSNIVQYSKDKETGEPSTQWPPTVKAKVYQKSDNCTFNCETFNTDKEEVDFRENVVKGSYVQGLMSCSGVWFAGGKFGVSWVMKQMIVWKPNRITGYSFLDDSDDEFEVTSNNSNTNNFVNDSDETDNETDNESENVTEEVAETEMYEEVEVEEVVPKPKKKRVTRKRKKKNEDTEEVSVSSHA